MWHLLVNMVTESIGTRVYLCDLKYIISCYVTRFPSLQNGANDGMHLRRSLQRRSEQHWPK